MLAIFRAGDALHCIRVQVFEADARDYIILNTLKRLNYLNTVGDSLRLMREPDRLRQRLPALLSIDKVHERGGLDTTQTGRTQRIIAKLGRADTGGQTHYGQTTQQAEAD